MKRLIFALLLILGSCSSVTVETGRLTGTTAVENPSTTQVEAAAGEICARHVWVGIPEPAEFLEEATEMSVDPVILTLAVRRQCPNTIYRPLSRAEVDWCGDGLGFGQNFFAVIAEGVDLGIESFTVVEPGLLAKATNRNYELTDYEVELFTAELQTMTESSRFERDWAEACRATF